MPCKIVEVVANEQVIILLHAANYFTRKLSVTERAAATRALGEEVERMVRSDPLLTSKPSGIRVVARLGIGGAPPQRIEVAS